MQTAALLYRKSWVIIFSNKHNVKGKTEWEESLFKAEQTMCSSVWLGGDCQNKGSDIKMLINWLMKDIVIVMQLPKRKQSLKDFNVCVDLCVFA